ncbi:hypothetical protein GVAV_000350 [Gurleya vavrai]
MITQYLCFTLFYIWNILANEAPKEHCKESYHVSLVPEDKEAMKQNPLETITAKEAQDKNLVPVKIITFFMSPNAPEAVKSVPSNVMMVFEQAVNKYNESAQVSGPKFMLLKPTAAQLVGAPREDEKEEGGEENAEGGEGENAEGENAEGENAEGGEGGEGEAQQAKPSRKR